MIKAISFDFWGTLARHAPEYSRQRTQFFASLFGMEEHEADDAYKACKRYYDFAAESFGSATTPIQAIKRLMEGRKLTRNSSAIEIMIELIALAKRYPPTLGVGVADALKAAAPHYTLCVTSNTNFISGMQLREVLDGVPISHFSFSDEFGLSKPDSDFFRYTLWGARRFGLVTEAEMLHIGDNRKCDIKGAKKVGMQAAFVESPEGTAALVNTMVKEREEKAA